MDTTKKYNWHKIANSKAEFFFKPNGLLHIEVSGKQICIARNNNDLYACSAKCPHAGGNIFEGFIDTSGNVICPLHRYKFNLQSGRNVSGEGYFLKTYPLDEREDGVYLGIEITSMFHWL